MVYLTVRQRVGAILAAVRVQIYICNNAVGQQLDTGANLGQISSIKFNYQCKPRGGGAGFFLKRFVYTEQVRLVYLCYYII